jgi:hypothetical protein
MSCCDGNSEATQATTQKEQIEKILASLPAVVHGHYETGGHQLQGLRYTIPPPDGVQRTYGRPEFLQDGSIQYPTQDGPPPAEINGFFRDEKNSFLFHPLWGECFLRMQGSKLDPKTGEITVRMVCNNPEAIGNFQKFVTAQQCAHCPVRRARKNPA